MVSAYNTEGKEAILKGKAIGFGRKKGDEVDQYGVDLIRRRLDTCLPDMQRPCLDGIRER
ncbi:hypothetical protein LBYZC6_35830 [Lacrimispora brassicae]